MNLEPRQEYGLGSIVKSVKKAVSGAAKGIKSLAKSDVGKIGLLLGGGYLAGGGTFFGKGLPFLKAGGGFSMGNLGTNLGLNNILSKGTGMSGLTKGLLTGGALASIFASQGISDEQAEEIKQNPVALRSYLTQYYKNLNQDASDTEVNQFVETNMAEYKSNGGRIGAMYGGRIGYQIGGDVAYDATDSIYGSSAATFTPDTILGPQGNQIQAQTGVNPTLQGSQNPFKNLGFLDTERHFDNNQLLKNAVSRGELSSADYNRLGGFDVAQTMGAGNPVLGGIGNLIGSTAYNAVQSIRDGQPILEGIKDIGRNVQGGTGLISDDLKAQYESIINSSTPTPDAGTNLTQYSNIPELTRVMDDNPNINSLAEANDYLKMQAGVVPGFTKLKNSRWSTR